MEEELKITQLWVYNDCHYNSFEEADTAKKEHDGMQFIKDRLGGMIDYHAYYIYHKRAQLQDVLTDLLKLEGTPTYSSVREM